MLMKQQRRFQQQQKCLHVITCLLFSCLLLLIEWQAALATPILTKSITSATTTSSKTAARQGVGGVGSLAARRLREHAKPSRENTRRGHKRSGGLSSSPCEHKSLGELIKTSPVILKALGAHIFNHDDDEDLRILHNSNDALLLKWQNEQNKVLTSLKRTEQQQQQKFPYSTSSAAAASTSQSSSSPLLSLSAKKAAEKTRQLQNKQKLSSRAQSRQQQQTFSDAATNRAAMLASMNADAILITLTPETIYKGASLLKMTPNAGEHATSRTASSNGGGGGGSGSSSTSTNSIGNSNANSDGNGGSSGSSLNAGTINSSEASYLYEGQLNASVQPLSCFDDNLLKLLPSDLIIFGKLITIDEQQQQQQRLHQTQQQHQQQTNDFLIDLNDYTLSSGTAQHHQQQPSSKDILKISINGLHRWSAQFENYIWKHLGWDDWSDFTVCSVACGKGVQQRFRRCLLDNPMVNLNMNFNKDNNDNDDDEEDDIDVDMDVDADVVVEMELEEDLVEDEGDDSSYSIMVDDVDGGGDENEQHKTIDGKHNVAENFATSNTTTTTTTSTLAGNINHQNSSEKSNILITGNMLHFVTTPQTKISVETTMKTEEDTEVMRIFEGHFNDTYPSALEATASDTLTINNGKSFKEQLSSSSASDLPTKDKVNATKSKQQKLQQQQQQKRKAKHRKHKSAKFYSTMFCEGYNIEQRNCNSFECSDDINDLLKFYRKYPTTDETNTASTQTMMMDYSNTMAATVQGASSVPTIAGTSSLSTMSSEIDGTAQNNENLNTFTTPINMGYVLNWHNILNFTIMLTLRVKNDSYTTATIFSIRNSTHNLYLESCKDGLRLYLERDKTTEMLPIKFNLYDYHWHQVAISIQNGDFISIHVDCSWTNSFVVSKRLFSLPLAADVEIGRGFNGELQQLLILPEHQERYQCSEKRTSINEVKRYIIDTFIDDYAN